MIVVGLFAATLKPSRGVRRWRLYAVGHDKGKGEDSRGPNLRYRPVWVVSGTVVPLREAPDSIAKVLTDRSVTMADVQKAMEPLDGGFHYGSRMEEKARRGEVVSIVIDGKTWKVVT